MNKQLTFADVFNQLDLPIAPGDYVQHRMRPGVPLLVVSTPYYSKLGYQCIKVKDVNQGIFQVFVEYITRY